MYQGIPFVVQWVKNLAAAAWVAVETGSVLSGQWVKGTGDAAAVVPIQSLAWELEGALAMKFFEE